MSEKYKLGGGWDEYSVSADLRTILCANGECYGSVRRSDRGWEFCAPNGGWIRCNMGGGESLEHQLDRATARIARETGWIPLHLKTTTRHVSPDLTAVSAYGFDSKPITRDESGWYYEWGTRKEKVRSEVATAELDRIAAQVKRPAFVEEYARLGIDSSHNQKFTVTPGTRIAGSGSVGVSSAYLFAKYDPVAGYTLTSFDDETDEPTQVRKRPLERPCEGCEEKEAAPKRLYCSVECWKRDASLAYEDGGRIQEATEYWVEAKTNRYGSAPVAKIGLVPDAKPVRPQISVDDPDYLP